MLKRIAALCLAASAFIAGSAKADLIGTSVTGSLQFGGVGPNYLDPANGFVPVGPENKTLGTTVPINTPQVEFGFQDGINHDTADFTGTTLTFTDVATGGGSAAQHYVFTDAAFAGLTLTELSDNFGGSGSTASLVGTTLTVDIATFNSNGTFSASYSLAPAGGGGGGGASTPLPLGVWAGAAALAFAALCRRQLKLA